MEALEAVLRSKTLKQIEQLEKRVVRYSIRSPYIPFPSPYIHVSIQYCAYILYTYRDTEEQLALQQKKKELEELKAKGSQCELFLTTDCVCVCVCVCVCAVDTMTRRRNELQQKLKHFPTDSLRAKVLKDTVVDGRPSLVTLSLSFSMSVVVQVLYVF